MHRFLTTVLSALALAALAAPAANAKTHVAIGLGDQSPAMFGAKDFRALHVKKVRYFVRWDATRVPYALAAADAYVTAARKAGARVFMHISTSNYAHGRGHLPTTGEYKRYAGALVKHFRSRGVREFGVWNEANHVSEPTYRNPKRAAQFFHIMRSVCKGCTIVALDVLDQRGASSYISRFYHSLSRSDRAAARLVGIHNYGDTNRHRVSGTRNIISAVRKQNRRATFWFTETGGIVNLGKSFKCSPSRAAKSLKYMFTLARKYRASVKRLYAYNWFGSKPSCKGFDSGLVTYKGARRPGYNVFKSGIRSFDR